MGSIATGLRSIAPSLRALFDSLRAPFDLFHRFLCDALRAYDRMGRMPKSGECCVHVPASVHKRADPLLYAQYYLMAQGLAVTWDNPDIQLFRNGSPANPWDLLPATDYEVRIRVWNGSYDGPAVNLPVLLSFLSFGAGTVSTFIGAATVDLGVKGSVTCPAFASIPWRTPAADGHYCLQTLLFWTDDKNPDNNFGQKNLQVGKAKSPAVLTFAVRNDAAMRRRFTFEVDRYTLPTLPQCEPPRPEPGRFGPRPLPTRLDESRARWNQAKAAQGYGKFPVGDGWTVALDPPEAALAPGQQIDVRATITPNDPAFTGRHAFNVHIFAQGDDRRRTLAGGVTLLVERG